MKISIHPKSCHDYFLLDVHSLVIIVIVIKFIVYNFCCYLDSVYEHSDISFELLIVENETTCMISRLNKRLARNLCIYYVGCVEDNR